MAKVEEPPTRLNENISSSSSEKKIILSPETNQYTPPDGLITTGHFKRLGILNPAVIQDDVDPFKLTLLPRLIYRDDQGYNSCIYKIDGRIEGRDIKLSDLEETVFQAGSPHGERGVEDFRSGNIKGETVSHGFLVNFNGSDARTEYVRTLNSDPDNFSKWEGFGYYFPNISAVEAIDLVKLERYKKRWDEDSGPTGVKKALNKGISVSEVPYLGTKDCCILPRKIKRRETDGTDKEYYGVVIRLMPDIQIVYLEGFEELASHEFWQKTISNLENLVLLERKYDWEKSHIGLGSAPLEIESGILIPYHGAVMDPKRDYKFGVALLDKDDPQKVLARSENPLLISTETWERNGVVSGDVVFQTGHARIGKDIHLFYGAGDKYIAHVVKSEQEILDGLKIN